jgi:acyl carrier protein
VHEDPHAVLRRLLARIAPELDVDALNPAEQLQTSTALDSLDFLNLMAALRAETGIDVPESDFPQLASVDGFVRYVADRLATGPVAMARGAP